jgi:Primase C terminal 2 (PriCT-2)/Family of unknown function (DUF5906)
VRIGRAPKRLLLFRTDTPFRKMSSAHFLDDFSIENHIEVLGDGQQCVAYATHPETGKPYEWIYKGKSPLDIPARELPLLTREDAEEFLEHYNASCFELGWKQVKPGRKATTVDLDNPWVEDSNTVDISDDDLHARLMLVANAEDHDTWVNVGMALYHQFDGDDEGLKMWHDWSETADNYDSDALDRRWKSFAIEGKKRAPITARYILKLANEAATTIREQHSVELLDKFRAVTTLREWNAACDVARRVELDSLSRGTVAVTAKEKRDQITGTKTPLLEIKRVLAYRPSVRENMPKWVEPWVYDTNTDRFFNIGNKTSVTRVSFDSQFDRHAFTRQDILDHRIYPSAPASMLALNHYRINIVTGCRYMPGCDPIYSDIEGTFANLYREFELPERPNERIPRDANNIARFIGHFEHLLGDYGHLFLDWLAWIVQNPGKHANYAVLLQGVEGDGKSFFSEAMRAILGINNVAILNPQILHSPFNEWAHGHILACFEELRLVNERNKYEAMDTLKPNITNQTISIHPKGRAVFNARNMTSYLANTNHKDALPLDENSRRYLVLFSQWQSRERIRDFKRHNPNYYEKLYQTFVQSAGALRGYLLDHEPAADFDPLGDAPETEAKRRMVFLAKPEFMQALDVAIRNNDSYHISRDFVTSTGLHEVSMTRGIEQPNPKLLGSMLSREGYESLGKVSVEKEYITVWVRYADEFYVRTSNDERYVDTQKVRQMVAAHKASVQSDPL